MSAHTQTLTLSLFVLILSACVVRFTEATPSNGAAQEVEGYHHRSDDDKGAMEPVKKVELKLMLNDSRRKLNSFQMCALCTCCGGGASKRYCLPSPCCYAINCNIPNRPFGYCSFTPKTCNCFGCHL